jgi:hypothetical protein
MGHILRHVVTCIAFNISVCKHYTWRDEVLMVVAMKHAVFCSVTPYNLDEVTNLTPKQR